MRGLVRALFVFKHPCPVSLALLAERAPDLSSLLHDVCPGRRLDARVYSHFLAEIFVFM